MGVGPFCLLFLFSHAAGTGFLTFAIRFASAIFPWAPDGTLGTASHTN